MTGWHFAEDRVQVWLRVAAILPGHYLEQQETHRYIAHTCEKVTEKNGEQRQIASLSHYCSVFHNMLPSVPHWRAGLNYRP